MQWEFQNAFWAKGAAKWWFNFWWSFIFLKCINTYIYDVSIAFSLNTLMNTYSLSHCGFENAFWAEHAPYMSIITSRRGSAMQDRSIFTVNQTLFTVYTRIDAHKQTDSAILHLFTYLPPYTVSTSDTTSIVILHITFQLNLAHMLPYQRRKKITQANVCVPCVTGAWFNYIKDNTHTHTHTNQH